MNLTQISNFTENCEGTYVIENGALKCTTSNLEDLKNKMQRAWDYVTMNDLSIVIIRTSTLSFTIRFHSVCPAKLN